MWKLKAKSESFISLEEEFDFYSQTKTSRDEIHQNSRAYTFLVRAHKRPKQESHSSDNAFSSSSCLQQIKTKDQLLLVLSAKQNVKDRETFVREYLKVPKKQAYVIVRVFPRMKSYFPDLVQEGALGLLSALSYFSEDKLVSSVEGFNRYASQCSRNRMKKFLYTNMRKEENGFSDCCCTYPNFSND